MDPSAAGTGRREPVFNLPGSVTAFVAALVLIHAVRSFGLSAETDVRLLLDLAFVPARLALWWNPAAAAEVLGQAAPELSSGRLALARFLVEEASPKPWTTLTYAFLHGSWGHVVLNSVWLAAFGTPVARRCGPARFFGLAAASAFAGAATHFALHPFDLAPVIGASAAISGLMAASARFIFRPAGSRGDGGTRGSPSLPELVVDRRALLFLGVWFATNILFGVAAAPLGITDGSIAWEAHVGGFLAGLLLFPLFDAPRRPSSPPA